MGNNKNGNKTYSPEWLKAISIFISTVIIGGVALFMDHSFNERQINQSDMEGKNQHKLAKIEALAKFMPYLSSEKEEQQTSSIYAINAIGYSDLALRLSELKKNRTVSNAIMREATPTLFPAAKESLQPPKKEQGLGWVYLGDFSTTEKKWKTNYLDFNQEATPTSLKKEKYKVLSETGALNLREAMPNDYAEFAKIIRALQPGTELKILDTRPWSTTGYTWAKVAEVK